MNSSSSPNPPPPPPTQSSTSTTSEYGSGKKAGKPYTITKSRESWTEEEHGKFLEALHLFEVMPRRPEILFEGPKGWDNCTCASSAPQAQSFSPLPTKGLVPLQASMAYPSSINTIAPGYAPWDEASMLVNTASSKSIPPQDDFTSLRGAEADIGSKGVARINNSGVSGIGSSSRTIPSSDMPKQGKQATMLHGIPDFAKVYSFIGSFFDPDTKGHVQKLKEMDPINFETVLLLMRNLTVNLCSPDFEPIRKVMSSYDVSIKTVGVTRGIIPQNQPSDILLC